MVEHVDTCLTNGVLVTMDPERRIIHRGTVGIKGGRIVFVGKTDEAKGKVRAETEINLSGHAVFPGLINTNTHLFQTLLKGLGDDRELIDWYGRIITPAAAQLTQGDCYVAALLGCIEAIRSGTTTVVDCMYTHPRSRLSDEVIRAFKQAGIRGILQRGFSDIGEESGVHPALVESIKSALGDTERLIRAYNSELIRVWLSPLCIFCASEEAFRKSREFAVRHKCWLSLHLGESKYFQDYSQKKYGCTESQLLDRIGFLGPDVQAVHSVWLTKKDLRILRAHDVKVSHQPVSNMYLSDGVAPIPRMLSIGITVGLGTDGAASNNNQDMINVLKTTALLHKVVALNPTIITAEKVLEMATIEGARSVGLDAEIGSIEVGKRADLMALNLRKVNTAPVHHPVSALVYSATTRDIDFTMVDGKTLMADGKLVQLDEEIVIDRAIQHAKDLVERAGLKWLQERGWGPLHFNC